jgi:hypothetical protein
MAWKKTDKAAGTTTRRRDLICPPRRAPSVSSSGAESGRAVRGSPASRCRVAWGLGVLRFCTPVTHPGVAAGFAGRVAGLVLGARAASRRTTWCTYRARAVHTHTHGSTSPVSSVTGGSVYVQGSQWSANLVYLYLHVQSHFWIFKEPFFFLITP